VVEEVRIGAQGGPAGGRIARSGPGQPLPLIERDFDPVFMAVEREQGMQQFGLIPSHDDEARQHWPAPPSRAQERRYDSREPQRGHHTPAPSGGQARTNFPTDPPPGINLMYHHDTHHPVGLDGAEAAAGLRAPSGNSNRPARSGGPTVNPAAAPPWTASGSPPSPGWTILTHSGSNAERRAWQRRIGQAV
jgi:hypothetical protein